jgi:hypothetical protein
VTSGLETGGKPCFPGTDPFFECVVADIDGKRFRVPLALLREPGPESKMDMFPGAVIEFMEPGNGDRIGERLTIWPFLFSFRSDAETGLLPGPGPNIKGEHAIIFRVEVQSDTLPEIPEPGSFFLSAIGLIACIGLRSRFRHPK